MSTSFSLSFLCNRIYIRDYEDDLQVLHLIRGGIGSPLQLICQSVLVTYGIRPLVDSNGSNLNIVDWQGNVVSIAILLPTSLALSVITVIKVAICNYKRKGIYFEISLVILSHNLMYRLSFIATYILFQEIVFINFRYLVSTINHINENKKIKVLNKEMIFLVMCFLPLYMVSAVFRITTFILLLTYLNVWAFFPMIVSLILNICSVQFTQTTLEKKSNRSDGCISKNLVAATAAVFIPIGIIEPFPGKVCNISQQNCFGIK